MYKKKERERERQDILCGTNNNETKETTMTRISSTRLVRGEEKRQIHVILNSELEIKIH